MSTADFGNISALLTALFWGLSPIFSFKAITTMGVFRFAMARFTLSSLAVLAMSLAWENPFAISASPQLALLALSGVIGIALGDIALFRAISIVGPRRASILYALHAPVTAISAVAIFQEKLNATAVIGLSLAFCGVFIAIIFKSTTETKGQAATKRLLIKGVLLCLIAVTCQTIGSLVTKASISTIDPLFATFIRTSAATLVFFPAYLIFKEQFSFQLKDCIWNLTAASFLGSVLGVTFFIIALEHTSVYNAVILSSLAPIFYILCMSLATKERFHYGAWIGTAMSILGTVITLGAA